MGAIQTCDRHETGRGELVLRHDGEHYEIISNGVFLMDTRAGASERLLVRAPLELIGGPCDILIGGLGVGFSLAEAAASPHARSITVVEREEAVIGWHGAHLRRFSEGALDDPRVRVEHADLPAWLDAVPDLFDIACLDIDNGPDWTVTEDNAALYSPTGLDLLARKLRPGGVLAVWSASASPAFADRLRDRFAEVTVHEVAVARGEPDLVYLARRAA